jgi:hypothetical protein
MMRALDNRGPAAVAAVLGLLVAGGCHSIGPGSVARDRFDYSDSVGESWKRQTLLNIVKLRYVDPPIFVDVGQIVAGYTLQTSANVGGQISSASAVQGNSVTLGGSGVYVDRPTVTYMPLTGNKFIKSLMTPLQPESVFFMIEAGWPADGVLGSAVASMNGLRNQEATIAGVRPPDPDFLRVLELMRKMQLSGAVSLRVVQDKNKGESSILTIRSRDIPAQTLADGAELRRLLRISPDATEFKLVFGSVAANDHELAVVTRSVYRIMTVMASQVDAPAEDVAQGRASPGFESTPGGGRTLKINSSRDRPTDAFVTVAYRDHWFWIDDRDLRTKRAFAFMMMLFTLAETGEREPPPLITIPAQ